MGWKVDSWKSMNLVRFLHFFFSYDDTMELPPELVLTGAVSDDKSTAVFFEIF